MQIQIPVRWADNTKDLAVNLRSGLDQIEAMKSSADRLAKSLGGEGLFRSANNLVAAIDQLGGVTKLTASEQERATSMLDRAIGKYEAMGRTAPSAMLELRDALKGSGDAAGEAHGFFDKLFDSFAVHVAEGMLLRDVLRGVISFGKEALAETARIEDLSQATGISTEALQQFAYVGSEFGVDMETMARGVEQLSAKLANGDKNATSAVEALGLSVARLRAEGPKEAFLDIVDALGRLEDPMTKAGLTTELFGGRLGKQLLPMLGEFRQKLDEVPKGAIVSDENVKLVDTFDDGLKHLEQHLKAATVSLLGWMAAKAKSAGSFAMEESLTVSASADERRTSGQDIAIPTAQAQQVISNAQAIANELKALRENALAPLSVAQRQQINDLKEWGKGEEEIAHKIEAPVEAVHRYLEAHKQGTEQLKKFKEAEDNLLPVLTSPAWDGSIASALKLGGSIHDVAVYFGESDGVIRQHAESMKTWDKIVGIEAPKSVQDLSDELHKLGTAIPQKFFDDGAKAAAELMKVQAGGRLTTDALQGIGVAAKPAMDDLNAALGTVGVNWDRLERLSIAGLQHVAAESKKDYEAMVAHSDMFSDRAIANAKRRADADQREAEGTSVAWDRAFTGLSAGVEILDQMDNQFAKIGSQAIKTFEAVSDRLAEGDVFGAVVAAVTGGIKVLMSLEGPSKDELAARDKFKSIQLEGESLTDTINRLGQELAKAGKTGTESQAMIKRALDATHVSAEAERQALQAINDVIDAQKQDDADLEAAITKYKFSIEELGPAMQKQRLDEQAQQLLNDWRLLVGSGINVATVNEHMASSINDYLALARATGQEVPIAMKPILEKMIEQGALTDETGAKITSLGDIGVTFSETMTQGFQRVVDKLQELLDKIGGVASGLGNIPNVERTVDITTRYWSEDMGGVGNKGGGDPNNPYASLGGMVTTRGIQYRGFGGEILPFVPRGTDTVPAMLTPGEQVLNTSDAADWRAGKRGDVTSIDDARRARDSQMRLERYMTTEFKTDIARAVRDELQNRGGRRA